MVCTGCKQEQPADEFYWRNRQAGVRQKYCRTCKAKYNAKWYEANKEKHKISVRANSQRYYDLARDIIEKAKDVPCVDCGNRFPLVCMDFDHVRGKKSFNISKIQHATETTLKRLVDEIAKCEVVCSNCHRIRTSRNWGSRRRSSVERTPVS